MVQSEFVPAGRLERHRDAGIGPEVAELRLVMEGADDDLAGLDADPGHRDLGRTVAVEGHDVGERPARDERLDGARQREQSHSSNRKRVTSFGKLVQANATRGRIAYGPGPE